METRTRCRAAYVLSAAAGALTAGAALAGLLVEGLYDGGPAVAAVTRGSDLAALVVAVPLLALALAGAVRGSARAHLAWLGLLAYLVYDYAYYVYGSAFNDLFVVHVAILMASVFALGLALVDLDVAAIGSGSLGRATTRSISGLLMVLGGSLILMWVYNSVNLAITGARPADVLPVPPDRVHLGYALDLTLFAPVAVLAAVLLWRRTAWGQVLGVVVSVFAGVYQLNYLAGRYLVADAVAGVARFDGLGVVIAAALLGAAGVLLKGTPARTTSPKGSADAHADRVVDV